MVPICPIAASTARTIARPRAQPRPAIRANDEAMITEPRIRWAQPQVVKSRTVTPAPPTVTTLSLRIAPSPHIASKKPTTKSVIAANVTHPLASNSARGAEVVARGAVVAMEPSFRGPFLADRRPATGERASPAGGDAPPSRAGEHAPMRLTWIGHATVLLDLGGVRLLTDPVLRGRLAHLRRHGPAPAQDVAAGVDAVLLSHQHLDHFDVPSLRRIDRSATMVAPRGAGGRLRRLGFTNVIELAAGEETEVHGVRIEAVPATHDGRRHPLGDPADALGFVIDAGARVYFAGDT